MTGQKRTEEKQDIQHGVLARQMIPITANATRYSERPSFSELAFSVLVASEINVLVIVAMVSTAIAAPVVAVLVRVFTVNDVNFSAGISVSSSCALHGGTQHASLMKPVPSSLGANPWPLRHVLKLARSTSSSAEQKRMR